MTTAVPTGITPALMLALITILAPRAHARQAIELSLEEALARAEATSEPLVIAEAGLLRARGEELRARSAYFPQITASIAYTRTFADEFSGLGGNGGAPPDAGGGEPPGGACGIFVADTTLPLAARVDTLERVVECLADAFARPGGPGFPPDLSSLFGDGFGPFGSPNRYDASLFVSLPIYTGGRRVAQTQIAEAGLRAAEVELRAQRAQLVFDVTQAYFDALLAARLLDIAEQTLAQAERTLAVTLVAVEAGDQAEFDALRARVARDNQRAEIARRRAERDVAFARLRTLVGIPLAQPIALTTELGDEVPPAVAKRAPDPAGPDTVARLRSTVRQAAEAVRVQEGLLEIARAQRRPQITLTGQFGQVAFPSEIVPRPADFITTASLTIGAEIPIFTGGRIRADELIARADLREAAARYDELLDLAAEDARAAIELLEAARAAFDATGSTIEEARRAYAIAELRYQEGVASLLELTDTRLLLEEALVNRAIAARDLQVAQTRLILLPDLPLPLGERVATAFQASPSGTALPAGTRAGGAVSRATGTRGLPRMGGIVGPAGTGAVPGTGGTGVTGTTPGAGTGAPAGTAGPNGAAGSTGTEGGNGAAGPTGAVGRNGAAGSPRPATPPRPTTPDSTRAPPRGGGS